MKDNKHIQTFEQHQENLNIPDNMNTKINESMDDMEKEIINLQIDYAIKVLKQLVNPIKSYNLSTEEYNKILFRKIKELEKKKFEE